MMARNILIRNFVLFQIGWFACVLGGAYPMPVLGSTITLLIITLHLWLSRDARAELKLLMLAFFIGLLFESLMVNLNLAIYSNGMLLSGMAPHWMILMWPLFATTLNLSMSWMKNLAPLMVAVLGALLAPSAYFAGARLDAVVFEDLTLSLSVISLGWAILLPLLVLSANRFNGYLIMKESFTTQRSDLNV